MTPFPGERFLTVSVPVTSTAAGLPSNAAQNLSIKHQSSSTHNPLQNPLVPMELTKDDDGEAIRTNGQSSRKNSVGEDSDSHVGGRPGLICMAVDESADAQCFPFFCF